MKRDSMQGIWPGVNCEVVRTPRGTIVSGRAQETWRHPWWIDLEFALRSGPDGQREPKPGEPEGEWRATVWPGFVNGRDAYIQRPTPNAERSTSNGYAALTEDDTPYLVLSAWRNPVVSAGVVNGVSRPGEGYPAFFESMGVRPAALGGELLSARSQGPDDESRTREIRAMDLVLTIPRVGTRLEYGVGDPGTEAQTEFLQTVYLNDYLLSVGGRSVLSARSKYREPEAQTLEGLYGLLLKAGDDQFDARKIATVWMVSPPDAGEDAVPDQTWEPYVQHFVFWNVNHATNIAPKLSGSSRLTLDVPLAGGVAQPVINNLLARINDQQAEAEAFLRGSVPAGHVWTP